MGGVFSPEVVDEMSNQIMFQGIYKGDMDKVELISKTDDRHYYGKTEGKPSSQLLVRHTKRHAQSQTEEAGHQRNVLEISEDPYLGGEPSNNDQLQIQR